MFLLLLIGCGNSKSIVPALVSPPKLEINVKDGTTNLAPDVQITVKVASGEIEKIVLQSQDDNSVLKGNLSPDKSAWTYFDGLVPGTKYSLQVQAAGPAGTASKSLQFSTLTGQHLVTSPFPGDGSTVGVGMPIMMVFNTPIPEALQANLVNHIVVSANPQTTGAWHWFSSTEAHWRPENYWKSGTKVHIDAKLQGVDAGNGYWGFSGWYEDFTIGEKHVSMIDNNTLQMNVYQSDKLIYTWPVSMGVDSTWPTISGTLVVRYKDQDVLMDSMSLTPPIPRNAPNGYYEHVYWDTAISTDGFYIHAAPWSVNDQGVRNVSHGCVNLSTDRAITFFNFSLIGDVVIIQNTKRAATADDGEGDWQIPFAQYANSGGAAPSSASPSSSQEAQAGP